MNRLTDRVTAGPMLRLGDVAFAAALFVALLPAMALVACATYRPGCPLITRRRCSTACGRGVLLYEFNCPDIRRGEPAWNRAQRVRDGGLLPLLVYRCRGDQLPQLVNVLRGDLALFPRQNRASFLTD